jgi:hypothetical protein
MSTRRILREKLPSSAMSKAPPIVPDGTEVTEEIILKPGQAVVLMTYDEAYKLDGIHGINLYLCQ